MVDENENETKETKVIPEEQKKTDIDLAKEILELKEKSVSKEDYGKLQRENQELKGLLLNGRTLEQKPAPTKESLQELYKKWQAPNQTNIEYCNNMLAYRKALMESGEVDPFLPFGKDHGIPTNEEIASAEKVARVIEECIKESNGDSEIFTAMLNSRMVDPSIKKKK